MNLQFASLNSGSNGNCYYVGNETEAVLIDAGISLREIERRMSRLQLPMDRVKALFISHEHSDHVTGLTALTRKFKIPVFITEGTHSALSQPLDPEFVQIIKAPVSTQIGGLEIHSFSKHHDAAEPISFVVSYKESSMGVFTDIGHACAEVKKQFKRCDAVLLESNYCDTMLEEGRYPDHLKRRIRGRQGHLSNDQALELFLKHKGKNLHTLILGHLSQNNNTMDKVSKVFNGHSKLIEIVVASRHKESPLFTITRKKTGTPNQLSLF